MSLKVGALAGSPRARSLTHRLLETFLEGMGEGTAVTSFDVRDLTVNPCRRCFSYWFTTPGRCAQDDDFLRVAAGLARADAVILAAPLYFDGLPGPVSTLPGRCVCRACTIFVGDGRS